MAKAVDPFKMTSDQLYKLAAFARRGEVGNFRMKPPDDEGNVECAVLPRKDFPVQEKVSRNGWLYATVTADGEYA